MNVTVHPGSLAGTVQIPASKSHTIRALIIAALAEGESVVRGALASRDTEACISVLRGLGVEIEELSRPTGRDATAGRGAETGPAAQVDSGAGLDLRVCGTGGRLREPQGPLDCMNSGTTLYLALSMAALQQFPVSFTGDEQLRRRSAGPLLTALEALGAKVTREGTGDCVPFTVEGPIEGGPVTIECPTSQYLSSLLLAAPLTPRGMEITVPLLNERPYVELTLDWLERQGIAVERMGWERFAVPGGATYRAYDRRVPGDFSSATFFLVAAALGPTGVTLGGLDMTDSQGDREVVSILERLGATVDHTADHAITVRGPAPDEPALAGGTLDLNAMPDSLPALAILGTRCAAPLRLENVPQAREKETDRIAVMAEVVNRLGGRAHELSDGLVIHPGRLAGGTADSHGDHRVAMALAIAGLSATGPVTVTNAGVADITFPGFYEALTGAGARLEAAGTRLEREEE